MSSVSFTNSYMLYIIIPLVVLIAVPFILGVRKKGLNFHTITSLVLHLIIAVLISLSAGGLTTSAPSLSTEIIVLADVSYSDRANYEKIDTYVEDIENKNNGSFEMSLIAFGRDYQLLTSFGEKIRSVKNNTVDTSSSDIASALEYSSTLFKDDCEKRIILLSDGKETDGDGYEMARKLQKNGIRIDAIYLDENSEDTEVQINEVTFSESTFLNREEKAKAVIETNFTGTVTVNLYEGNVLHESKDVLVNATSATVEFDLVTYKKGVEEYHIEVVSDFDHDEENNTYYFTQYVSDEIRVLAICGSQEDIDTMKALYKDYPDADFCLQSSVKTQIEYFCNYDEIVFSGVDVRTIPDANEFITNLQLSVVNYGKSLMVYGGDNSYDDSSSLGIYNKMLPVNFDISKSSVALCLVIDTSTSMSENNRLVMAKKGAIQCLDLLGEDDYISVISFNGSVKVVVPLTRVIDREDIENKINNMTQDRGTMMCAGLEEAYNQLHGFNCDSKQVLLISDGQPNDSGQEEVAERLLADGATTSVINISSYQGAALMKAIAAAGNGNYYYVSSTSDLPDIMLNEVNNDIGVTRIQQECSVNIVRPEDSSVEGLTDLPVIEGLNYSMSKYSATTVLTVDFDVDGVNKEAPLYVYWDYGLGKVGIFNSNLCSSWAKSWLSDTDGSAFLNNVIDDMVPDKRTEEAYTVSLVNGGSSSTLEVIPYEATRSISVSVDVTYPSNKKETYTLSIDSDRFTVTFPSEEKGSYVLDITYKNSSFVTTNRYYKTYSYSEEYDDFLLGNEYLLYQISRENGVLATDIDTFLDGEVSYKLVETTYDVPLLLTSLCLFVIDLIIRKLKWSDILYFFNKTVKAE